MKELRNEIGGHLDLRNVEFATSNFTPKFVGKVTWDKSTRENYAPPLQLHYANEIMAGVVSSKLQNGVDMVVELRAALELIMEGYQHANAAMYALVHAFLWDRFGR